MSQTDEGTGKPRRRTNRFWSALFWPIVVVLAMRTTDVKHVAVSPA
jgi:hypothetical protein